MSPVKITQSSSPSGRRARIAATAFALSGALALSGPVWAAGDSDRDNKTTTSSQSAQKDKAAAGSDSLVRNNQLKDPPEPAAAKKRELPLKLDSKSKVDLGKPAKDVAPTKAGTRHLADSVPSLPGSAKTFGNSSGKSKTLVLFDTSGNYANLGEMYAVGTAMLASHSGTVTTLPVADYKAGLAGAYTGVTYVGSTYDEKLPRAFIDDVLTGDVPVMWSGFNIWKLASTDSDRQAFISRFGWDAATSYIDSADPVRSVSYKGQTLTRNKLNNSGILAPHIVDSSAVKVLATATCGETAAQNCDKVAQTQGGSFPWAVQSSNLTYIGEIPLAYMEEKDRYLAYADLITGLDGKNTGAAQRTAAVRIEDVSPETTVEDLKPLVDYFVSERIPFQLATIPQYVDAKGVYNQKVPNKKTFNDNPELLKLLKYAQANGGTVIQHGTTHQYEKLNNPYNAVSGDDFEFYRSWCTDKASGGPAVDCKTNSWVQLVGPLPNDSVDWARKRVASGQAELQRVGLGKSTIFETPHYAASKNAYLGMDKVYRTRYERVLFFPGTLVSANSGKSGHFGQFFPYTVTDPNGTRILPENLGNYEPTDYNNHKARLGEDLVANARANLVVRDGNASFFFHPGYPVSELKTAVSGIRSQGYNFVAATQMN